MPNEFYVQPANPLGGMQEAIGGYLELEAQKKQEGEQEVKLQQASDIIRTGDSQALMDFMVKNPDLREHMITTQGHISKRTRAGKVQALKDILLGKPVQETMQGQIDLIRSEGGDPADAEAFLDPTMTDEERKQRALQGLAIYDPQAAKAYMEVNKVKKPEFKMGTGDMAGYVFNPSTGEFTIDATLKAQLNADAADLAAKERLDAKQVAGVNDKVTGLTKDVLSIHGAAASLDVLKGSSSPAAKIAAVFKFMKALDPTSTVRESELGMIYSAEGAAQGLANQVNKLLGEGAISEAGFQDIVSTSKLLANSAITTSRQGVDDYLSVIQDNLSPKQFEKMNARVPEPFDVVGRDSMLDLPSGTVDNGDGTYTLPTGETVRAKSGNP